MAKKIRNIPKEVNITIISDTMKAQGINEVTFDTDDFGFARYQLSTMKPEWLEDAVYQKRVNGKVREIHVEMEFQFDMIH